VISASNVKNILIESNIPEGTKGGSGSGSQAETDSLAKKKRGEFRETAFWEGRVLTDSAGVARLTFTLPDNLTSWQVESVGITKDTKLGAGYAEFVSRKSVMTVPLAPRFVIPGDKFSIGAKIFNQTEQTQTLQISLESPTLNRMESRKHSLKLKPGTTETVYFKVEAPNNKDEGSHLFTLSAQNDRFEDVVENKISITRNDTYETVATAGYTTQPSTREYIFLPENIIGDKGGLEVNLSATLSSFVSDALRYLFTYPYGCSEQIASKLSAIGIVQKGLRIKNIDDKFELPLIELDGEEYTVDEAVKKGLARIYGNQTCSGGFSYYPNLSPSYHLTLHLVNALLDLQEAGFDVEPRVIDSADKYLSREITSKRFLLSDRNTVVLTAYTLSRRPQVAIDSILINKISEILSDRLYLEEKISNISLAHLALYLVKKGYSPGTQEDIFNVLDGRIDIDSRGAHLKQGNSERLYAYYQTPIKDTALLLKAHAVAQRDNPILDKVARWILRSRSKDGAWGSTNNTLSVVDAFTSMLEWKQETESQFNVAINYDGKKENSYSFSPENILRTYTHTIPTSQITPNKLHIINLEKENKNNLLNGLYYDMALRYFLPVNDIPPRDEGFSIRRSIYNRDDDDMSRPIKEAKPGEILRGHLTITVPETRNYVTIEDYIPAGMELVNLKLATEDQSLRKIQDIRGEGGYGNYDEFGRGAVSGVIDWLQGFSGGVNKATPVLLESSKDEEILYGTDRQMRTFYPDAEESHDDRLFLFKEKVQPGVYEYDYFLRALIPGSYNHLPALVSELYFPENFGRTAGEAFVIKDM